MKDIYFLNRVTLSEIPLPHDNIISGIAQEGQFIVFTLETDAGNRNDFIRFYKPGAKGLVIRYHLTGPDCLTVYQEKLFPRYLSRLLPPRFIVLDDRRTEKFLKGNQRLVYLYHYIGDNSVIIKLFSYAENAEILLEANADYAEYEWVF